MPARTECRGRRVAQREFTLVLEGDEPLEPKNLDAWFEAGCDDATFGQVDGVAFADFARDAPSAQTAILSAIDQVESAVPTVRVIRVEPDDLVNASDIAERLGRTRESVRLLIAAERGPGGFPAPISHLKARGRLWRWADVARWARDALDVEMPEAEAAVFVAALNDALDLRRLSPELEEDDWPTSAAELSDRRLRWDRIFAADERAATRRGISEEEVAGAVAEQRRSRAR